MIANFSQADPADSHGDILDTAPLSGLAGQPLGVGPGAARCGLSGHWRTAVRNAPCFLRRNVVE